MAILVESGYHCDHATLCARAQNFTVVIFIKTYKVMVFIEPNGNIYTAIVGNLDGETILIGMEQGDEWFGFCLFVFSTYIVGYVGIVCVYGVEATRIYRFVMVGFLVFQGVWGFRFVRTVFGVCTMSFTYRVFGRGAMVL